MANIDRTCSQPVYFRATSMSFFNFLSQKTYPVNFQDQRLFQTEVIKEKVIFKMSALSSFYLFIFSYQNSILFIFFFFGYKT